MNRLLIVFSTTIAVVLGGCVTVPAPLEGDYPVSQPNQTTDRSIGAHVRWGGDVISSQPEANRTCFEVLARDLDRSYRPLPGDRTYGRFLACKDGFLDPAVFRQGREITVIGRIDEFVTQEVGEYSYRYPLLNASIVYLWPERPDVVVYDYGPHWWYGPYGYPYYYYPYRSRFHFGGHIHMRR